jgi:hypothetical protein
MPSTQTFAGRAKVAVVGLVALIAIVCLWRWSAGLAPAGPVIAGSAWQFSRARSMFEPRQWLMLSGVSALVFAALAWCWRVTLRALVQ